MPFEQMDSTLNVQQWIQQAIRKKPAGAFRLVNASKFCVMVVVFQTWMQF